MPDFGRFLKNVLRDVEKELLEATAENFRSQSFFGQPWAPVKNPAKGKAKILHRDGHLENSITGAVSEGRITFSSSTPYAAIHNEGGTISVTPAMKKYFWAKYYEASGGIAKKKDGSPRATKANAALSAQALYYKSLALMKVGSKITIPQRQFLGYHPQVDEIVRQVADANMKELAKSIGDELRRLSRK